MRDSRLPPEWVGVRPAPLVRVKVKITVKFPVCSKPKTLTYGEYDREFDFDSYEWSC